ncbi:MAG: dynamin family protein [Stygiobacter sp.]
MKNNGILSKIVALQNITQELEQQNLIVFHDNFLTTQKDELSRLKEKIINEKFYLVVIGLFKRGKSSLVNALLKKEVVPYSVVPLTSIVTLLEYGEENYAKIYFNDNRFEVCNIETIHEYITEPENPLNKKNVNHVIVFLNSDFLKKVTLVDTPGIGSTYENNTETTYSFVERIDAALFILSADLPISKTEVEFLTKLNSTIPKIIFVLNKTDLITLKETERIIAFNKSILKKVFNENDINILPVSAKLAINGILNNEEKLLHESRIEQLVKEIEDMLASYKHDVIITSARNQFDSMLKKISTILNIHLNALGTPIEELNRNYEEFLNSLEIMRKEKGDFEILINGKVKQLQEYVTNTLYEFAKILYNNFCDDFEKDSVNFFNKLKSEGIELVHKIYFNKIEQSFEELKLNLEKKIVDRFHNILIEYSQGLNRFLNELVKNFSNTSIFEFKDLVDVFDLKILTVFYFQFDRSYNQFCLSNIFIRNYSPKFFRSKILKQLKENIKRNIDMNTGRVNYDINYKIQESFRKFSFELNEKIEITLNMLTKIISDIIKRKENAEDSVAKQVKYLSNKIEILSLINNNN